MSRGITGRRLLGGRLALCVALAAGCADLSGPATSSVADDAAVTDTADSAAIVDGPDGWVTSLSECVTPATWTKVTWVADGDTLFLEGGGKVRFLGIDTPETTSKDCMAEEAKQFTFKYAGKGTHVCLTSDQKAGDMDHYGRLLRYVWVHQGGVPVMINARLVRLGLARVYYPFATGLRHELTLVKAQKAAEADGVGGWSACKW